MKKETKKIDNKMGSITVAEYERQVEEFHKTGIMKCPKCNKSFIKIKKLSNRYSGTWKPGCSCYDINIRLHVG